LKKAKGLAETQHRVFFDFNDNLLYISDDICSQVCKKPSRFKQGFLLSPNLFALCTQTKQSLFLTSVQNDSLGPLITQID